VGMAEDILGWIGGKLGPGDAEAAKWSELLPALEGVMRAKGLAKPNSKTLRALEILSEEFPSVRNTGVEFRGPNVIKETNTWEPSAFYSKPSWDTLDTFLSGKPKSRIVVDSDFDAGLVQATTHEIIHSLTGGYHDLPYWMTGSIGRARSLQNIAAPIIEGVADGAAATIAQKSYPTLSSTKGNLYWPKMRIHPGQTNPVTHDSYLHGGLVGRRVGDQLLQGKVPDQVGTIEELMYFLERARERQLPQLRNPDSYNWYNPPTGN